MRTRTTPTKKRTDDDNIIYIYVNLNDDIMFPDVDA
jgi:hypothetical protein